MSILEECLYSLFADLCKYFEPGIDLPTIGWVVERVSRTLMQYPAGIPRSLLLTELEAAWLVVSSPGVLVLLN